MMQTFFSNACKTARIHRRDRNRRKGYQNLYVKVKSAKTNKILLKKKVKSKGIRQILSSPLLFKLRFENAFHKSLFHPGRWHKYKYGNTIINLNDS